MTKFMTIAAVGALAIGLGACKKNEPAIATNDSMNVSNEMGSDANMSAASDPTSDAGFASAAAASDMFETESSKLALTTSKTPSVKGYAQMMIDQHAQSTKSLKAAVASMPSVTLPTTLPAEQQSMLDGLKGKTGKDFDKAYLDAQKTGHENALAAMKGYSGVATAGALKDFATKTTPVVQKHLDMLAKIKV